MECPIWNSRRQEIDWYWQVARWCHFVANRGTPPSPPPEYRGEGKEGENISARMAAIAGYGSPGGRLPVAIGEGDGFLDVGGDGLGRARGVDAVNLAHCVKREQRSGLLFV